MPDHPALRELKRGRRLRMLTHPSELRGFVRVIGCEPHGQVEDWVCGLPDGSRLHAHVMPDGVITVHRDRWDPARGWFSRALHVGLETTGGRIALAMTAARMLGWLP